MKYSNHILLFSALLITNCEDPSYLLDFDRGESTPENVSFTMLDAFTIRISFTAMEKEGIDSAVVYKASSKANTTRLDTLSFISAGNANVNDSDTLVFLDTAGTYEFWNYYTALIWSKNVSSLSSDTVSIYFQIPSPDCDLALTETGINQSVSLGQNYLTGVRILRESTKDTLNEEFPLTSDSIQVFQDSLSIDYEDTVQHYSAGLVYPYTDIIPNRFYTYTIQTFQGKNGVVRYSSTFQDSINFEASIPSISSIALSDSLVRVYISNSEDIVPYDSFYVFTDNDTLWTPNKKGSLGDLVYYRQKLLIDVDQTDTTHLKIMTKNDHYYTVSDSIEVSPLPIPGFRLVESGNFSWGCNAGDAQCDSVEGPIQNVSIDSFYMGVYEVTSSVYEDVTNWPPAKGGLPAENISFLDALNYCSNLNSNYPEYSFFIPSEPEWEYAAKYNIADQSATIYPWSNEIDIFNANYGNQNPGSIGVGAYSYPSHFGMFDMSGNVLEWTNNCFLESLKDSVVDNEDCWVVARGGGFWHGAEGVRTTSRYHLPQDTEAAGVGLRIAMRPY